MAHKILAVDDEQDILDLLEGRLTGNGYEVLKAQDAVQAFEKLNSNKIDLILLDVMLVNTDGFQIKAQLNKNPATARIPVIFLTAKHMPDDRIYGFKLGADDYLAKPFHPQELLARINSMLVRKDYYEGLSMRDSMTNVGNSAFFNEQFEFLFNVARRYGHMFSLVLFDINDFKQINDKHGHLVGDFVLCEFARIAKEIFRQSDLIARYGGDEFAVLLPGTGAQQAALAVTRLKEAIAQQPHVFSNSGKGIEFSVSAGIGAFEAGISKDKSQIFEAADKQLYQDKGNKSAPPKQARTKKILIVDDETETVFLLSERLQRSGYKVEMAFDALEAILKALKSPPDAILLDMRIPAGGGMHVLKQVRGNPKTAEVPVIILTANYDQTLKSDAMKLGISDYLSKPFEGSRLVERIKQIVQA